MQEKPSKACFRTTRVLDAADAVHSCFFSEGGLEVPIKKFSISTAIICGVVLKKIFYWGELF